MSRSDPRSPLFLTTRWSVVLKARDGSSTGSMEALEFLCRTYWYPLYLYVRGVGRSPDDARDLTQEFFARLLEKNWLEAASAEKGRFRSFLLVAMKHFMAKEWRRASALKRGGPQVPLPLDTTDAEKRYAGEPVSSLAPDEIYERRWAMTLLDQALAQLETEFAAAGKAAEFAVMKHWLGAGRGTIPYGELSASLGASEGAVRQSVHRMRKRFRAIFREAVSHTLAEGEDIDEELHYLVAILSRS